MRGKAEHVRFIEDQTGITPAYAGKSDIFQLRLGALEDHPRLCGEKMKQDAVR
mgnify:CR=1 FL=1